MNGEADNSTLKLTLPWPPTANTYWRHIPMGGGVRSLISHRGRQYRSAVATEVMAQRAAKRLTERLHVEVDAYAPDRRRRDLDNLLKAFFDACTHAGVWIDDSQIDRLVVNRRERFPGGRLSVTVSGIR